MAPMSSTLAHSQTRSLKASSKCRRTCIIALGRSRMAHLCLAVECESSVPCLSHFVYQMDKVEIRRSRRRTRVVDAGTARAPTAPSRQSFGLGDQATGLLVDRVG